MECTLASVTPGCADNRQIDSAEVGGVALEEMQAGTFVSSETPVSHPGSKQPAAHVHTLCSLSEIVTGPRHTFEAPQVAT